MEVQKQIESVIRVLEEMNEDASIPKNVKDTLESAIKALKEDIDISIRVNKALYELEEIADDPNLEPYTRTQVWNAVSALEKIV